MAMTTKLARETLKTQFLDKYMTWLTEEGEDVLRTGSNECAIPCVDANGDDAWLVVTFKTPTGSRDGDGYDGYAMAQDYSLKCKEKAEKARQAADAKAKKIAKAKAKKIAKDKAKKAKVKE